MSSGNITTEYTRQELAADEAVIRGESLVRNSVLRRALAVAARDYLQLHGRTLRTPDDGVALIVAWVMEASGEVEKG